MTSYLNENIEVGNICVNLKGKHFQIIEHIGNSKFKIKFLESGYENEVYKVNIKTGRVADRTTKDALSYKYKIGDIIENKYGQKAKIIDIERRESGKKNRVYLKIAFESGYESYTTSDNFMRGKVKDYLSPTILGVGILGYVENLKLKGMSEYNLWCHMLRRCYDNSTNTTYNDVEVCERWKRFDYFLEDLPKIKNYDLWKKYKENNPNKKNIYELDKDILINGNKLYSLEACMFVEKKYNAVYNSNSKNEIKEKIKEELGLK